MFSYFTTNADIDIRYPIKTPVKWTVLKRMYLGELKKVKEYYRNREYSYSNNNMLVRLIKTLARSPDLDPIDYWEYITNDVMFISKQFNITSNISRGDVLTNILFNGNSDEVFLYTNNSVDPIFMQGNWRTYRGINVISTDLTDTNYPVIFRYDKQSNGTTIFEIDLIGIMLQYYYWEKDRLANDLDTSVNIFLPMVVIPNITDSLVDHTIWNVFKNIILDREIVQPYMRHPFSIIDYNTGIISVLSKIVNNVTNTSMYISQLLKSVPMITNRDAYETLQITKSYYNRQSKWVLWVSRIDDIVTIHKMLGKKGQRRNSMLYSSMKYSIKNIERDAPVYLDILGLTALDNFKNNIDYLKNEL